MNSSLSSSPVERDPPHRKASLAERRPLFSSSDSGSLPILGAFTDTHADADTVVVTSGVEQKPRAFPAVDAATGSAVFHAAASSTLRKLPKDAGSVLGQSVTAMHRLSQEYRELLQQVSVMLAIPLESLCPTHSTASPRARAEPVLEATITALKAMTHAQLLEHATVLHEVVHNAVASVGLRPSVLGGNEPVTSSPLMADVVPSPVWGQQSHNATAIMDDPMSLTAGDLQHSLSAMSMIADPVRVTNEARKSIDNDGSKMINEYLVLDELGRGSFGKVKLAFDTLQCKMVAVKVVRKPRYWQSIVATANDAASTLGEGGVEQAERHFHLVALQREIAVMKKLRHKNIVSLFEVIDDPDSNKLYIVMQYIENGPIGKVSSDGTCTKHDPIELLQQASNILAGLQYLHARGIIHRDLKPENILCNAENEAFLADFGVSEFFDKTDASVVGHRGTKMFMAPELLSTGTAERGKAVDLWAVGVTLYALLAGHLPFASTDEILDADRIPSWDDVPSYWKPVLERLLQRNPKDRISATRARRLIKQIILERVEEEADDELLLVGAPGSAQPTSVAKANVLLEAGDLTFAITPMARPKKASSPLGTTAPQHLRPGAPDMLRPTFSAQESFNVLPQFQIRLPVADHPAEAVAARVTRDEEAGAGISKPTGGASGGRGGRATTQGRPDKATSALSQHFNLRNATVIDLSELEGPGGVMLGGGSAASRARGAAAVDFAALAASAVQRAISTAGTTLNGNEEARRESSRCHRRLQELLTEQRQLETQRRLIPSGIPRW